jgi:hypothetical protein
MWMICVISLALGAVPSQQAKPNFSGAWTIASTAPLERNGTGVVGGGPEMTITQDATVITIDRPWTGRPKVSVKLDGSEVRQELPGAVREGFSQVTTSRAAWDGTRLILSTTSTISNRKAGVDATVETIEVLSLTGGDLMVERNQPRRLGPKASAKETFKKRNLSPDPDTR